MKQLGNYTQENHKAGTKRQIPCCCLEARLTGKPRCFRVSVSLLESPSTEFWRTLHSHAEPAAALGTRGRARSRIPRTFRNAIQLLATSGSCLDLWGCILEGNLEGVVEGRRLPLPPGAPCFPGSISGGVELLLVDVTILLRSLYCRICLLPSVCAQSLS